MFLALAQLTNKAFTDAGKGRIRQSLTALVISSFPPKCSQDAAYCSPVGVVISLWFFLQNTHSLYAPNNSPMIGSLWDVYLWVKISYLISTFYDCFVVCMQNYVITRGHFWPSDIVIACICLSMCLYFWVSMCQQWTCQHDNSSPIQVRINKFGTEVQNTKVKIPIVLGIDWYWSWWSNLN